MIFYLAGDETQITIEVFAQSYPDSSDYWGGNWLNANIESEIPGFSAKFDFQLRTDELKDFADQLKAMIENMEGKAALYNLDGSIELEGIMDQFGSIDWKVSLCYPAGNSGSLKFDFRSGHNGLHQSIRELDDVLSIFPVIGAP